MEIVILGLFMYFIFLDLQFKYILLKNCSPPHTPADLSCPLLCEDRLELLVVREAAAAHNDASSYVSSTEFHRNTYTLAFGVLVGIID